MRSESPQACPFTRPPDDAGGRAHGHLELEVKLLAAPEVLRRVLESSLIRRQAIKPAVTQSLVNTYYDTPAHWFMRNDLTLRVRWDGERWIQGLKLRIEAKGGVFRRLEWEQQIPSATPVADVIAGGPNGLAVTNEIAAAMPVFETRFTRVNELLEPQDSDGAQIAVAFDEGVIVAGTRSEPIAELELELISGSETALTRLAGALAETFNLRPGHASKAQRGYRLAGRTSP